MVIIKKVCQKLRKTYHTVTKTYTMVMWHWHVTICYAYAYHIMHTICNSMWYATNHGIMCCTSTIDGKSLLLSNENVSPCVFKITNSWSKCWRRQLYPCFPQSWSCWSHYLCHKKKTGNINNNNTGDLVTIAEFKYSWNS